MCVVSLIYWNVSFLVQLVDFLSHTASQTKICPILNIFQTLDWSLFLLSSLLFSALVRITFLFSTVYSSWSAVFTRCVRDPFLYHNACVRVFSIPQAAAVFLAFVFFLFHTDHACYYPVLFLSVATDVILHHIVAMLYQYLTSSVFVLWSHSCGAAAGRAEIIAAVGLVLSWFACNAHWITCQLCLFIRVSFTN